MSASPFFSAAATDLDPATTLVVVPARLAATRLPGKPLADIHGEPMIVHVWRRAREARIGRVIVAAGDAAIAQAVTAAGGESVLTDPDHPSGSDRVWEAVRKIDPQGRYRTIVNVQGDLPTLEGRAIRTSLAPLRQASVDIATLVSAIADPADRERPSVVKAAVAWAEGHHSGTDSREDGAVGRVLYFSRAPIPAGEGPLYHHIGLYAYRRAALERFVALPPSPLERREKLEQLRALEAGMIIGVAEVRTVPLGVDTAEDLEQARAMLRR